jgi:acyl-CoA synthetase (AMP-forming)/AMP-acid ligase II
VHDVRERERELTGPSAPFEMRLGSVLGERMVVFNSRAPHLRALLAASARWGDAEYLVFDERRISYREHLRLVSSVARALEERFGVKKGDRVAICAANCPEWIVTFWAALSLGALPVAMNGWWAGDEIRFALEDCRPKVLIADDKRLARLKSDPGVPVISVENDFAALTRDEAALPEVPIDEDDAACILYTSGTTGRPKGVVHTHRNVIALVQLQLFHGARMAAIVKKDPEKVLLESTAQRTTLVTNPLFHVSGLYTQVVTSLVTGARTVWTRGRFDPLRVLQVIERERVSGWSPHGAMGPRVIAHPDAGSYDLSSVTNLGSGGAPVPRALQEGLRRLFPNARAALTVGYGLTEATALATIAWGAELETHPTTVGKPLPTVEVSLRDGEIFLRSPLVMRGYWERPEETAAALGPGRWLRTGDLGRFEDGRLYIEARRRDLILRAAENVAPVEIEQRLEAHPRVKEAAVIGVPHPELGQEVKAVVVPHDGAEVRAEELSSWVADALAYFKVPALWEIRRTPLPRNAAGKLMRHLVSDGADTPFVED